MSCNSTCPYDQVVVLLFEENDTNRITNHSRRLLHLFNVYAAFEPEEKSNFDQPVYRVKLQAHSIETLEKAKKYLDGLLNPESCTTRFCPNTAAFQCVAESRDRIERDTCAVVKLAEYPTVEVEGRKDCVASALLLVDRKIEENAAENTGCRETSGRSKLESEDSSYDSDYENSDSRVSPNLAEQVGHDDVSRTVSDTLAAEFAEYVCLQGNVSHGTPEKNEEREDDSVFGDPNYTNRIEFALKLGYTERQGYAALQKLGPRAEQNELLAELIKLGASNPSPEVRGGGGVAAEGLGASNAAKRSDPSSSVAAASGLRHVVIDGSNVAMSHGNKELFSCRGIKLCVDWFKARGHKEITVFVPLWRKEASRPDAISKDQEILWELEKERLLVFTPSRQMGGRRMACHDDRYIVKLAAETDGVIVSNDNYRDLLNESPEYKRVVEERLLMYSFVNDRFMPPDDPMGRHGPSLDSFLHKQAKPSDAPSCPYGKKCTYGNKCKYYHPERGNQPHKSVSEQLAEQAKIHIQEVKSRECNKLKGTHSSPLPNSVPNLAAEKIPAKKALQRTKSLVVPALVLPSDTFCQSCVASIPEVGKSTDVKHGHQGLEDSNGRPPGLSLSSTWSSPFYEDCGNHLSVAKRLSDPESRKKGEGGNGGAGNAHRKLQRQLTLNPNYDPRLVHMRSYLQQQPQQQQRLPSTSRPEDEQTLHNKERLVRHSSAGAVEAHAQVGTGWNAPDHRHQNVTRIASAPDSYHQWHHPRPTNAAPPDLPRFSPVSSYVWGSSVPAPPTWHPPNAGIMATHEDQRQHLYYHLASIFPADQVRAAMEMHPEESNPQAICSTILAMFHRPE